jgi:hypothetical protein
MGRAKHKAEGRRTAEGWFLAAECGKAAQNLSTKLKERRKTHAVSEIEMMGFTFGSTHLRPDS